MYRQLKEERFAGEGWIDACRNKLNVCSHTANRYIRFFELVRKYPRIIICEIPYETIMYCMIAIVDALEDDQDLAVRFNVPLR